MDFKYVVPTGTIEEKDDKFYYTGGKTDGTTKAHNNMPAYMTIYAWHRTA